MQNSKLVKNKFQKSSFRTRNISPLEKLEERARLTTIRKPRAVLDGKKFSTLTTTGLRGRDFDERMSRSALGSQRAGLLKERTGIHTEDDYVAGEIVIPGESRKLITPVESRRKQITPMATNRITDAEIREKMPKILARSALQDTAFVFNKTGKLA